MMMTDFEEIKEQSIKEKSILESVQVKLEDALENARTIKTQKSTGDKFKIPSIH